MSKRVLDPAPEHATPGTVHYVNPDRPDYDHIEIRAEEDGSLIIRCVFGRLVVVPNVANSLSIRVER